jgi:hypothetical protein
VGIQTAFEGFSINTEDKLRKNQLKYELEIPMAHAAGDQQAHSIPEIMRTYRSGGAPWTVIIDPSGKVVFNDFHIDVEPAVALIEKLLHQKSSRLNPIQHLQNTLAVFLKTIYNNSNSDSG